MATLAVGGELFVDMSVMDYSIFFFGEISTATKKRYVLEFPDTDEIADFRGTGFKYNKDFVPTGGELEGFTLYGGGVKSFQIAGVDVSVKAFVKSAETASTADDLKITAQMFSKNDTIVGGALADGLMGFKGKDLLVGGGGADVLMGGAGNDVYGYGAVSESTEAARDTILGFAKGDRFSLSGITDFDFIGNTAFSGTKAEVAFVQSGGDTIINADSNGDGATDLSILIDGTFTLAVTDFIL